MNAQDLINYIANSEKKTPVKLYIKEKAPIDYGDAKVFGAGDRIVFGDWTKLGPIIEQNRERIEDIVIENDRRNSGVPLLDMKAVPARIEPGAVIREQVTIGRNAVIMMGAIINIGAVIGEGTMIDMGAVLGGRATVGKNCHVGAGAVLAGVIEPASATPVIIEDNVLIGANAVVIEGVHVGKGAVVAAGAIVIEDVPDNAVVAGCPAKVIKQVDAGTSQKTALEAALRKLYLLICRREGEPYPPLRGYFPTAVGKLLGASRRYFSFPTAVGKWPEGPIGLPFRQIHKSVVIKGVYYA